MHDDSFPAAEKILSDIEAVFKKDKSLTDFEILPVPVGENKSPVIHTEHALGLEQWCVRHLYLHVYHRILNLKQQQRLRREDFKTVARLLLGGVLLNPDNCLLWNIRRDFVLIGRFDCSAELHLAAVTLSRRPKCSEVFTYRRWLLGQLIAKSPQLGASFFMDLLNEEIRVTQMAASRYVSNYHAWNHRMWAVTNISPHISNVFALLVEDWTASEKWISSHVSEHSGFQYRQFLLKQLFKHLNHSDLCCKLHDACSKFFLPVQISESHSILSKPVLKENSLSENLRLHLIEIFERELSASRCSLQCEKSIYVLHTALLVYDLLLITELIRLYPGHEALWSHRRYIIFSICSLAKQISSQLTDLPELNDGIPVPKAQKLSACEVNFQDEFLWKLVLWHEDKLFVECTVSVEEECFQSKLAIRHKKWLQQILFPRMQVVNTDQDI